MIFQNKLIIILVLIFAGCNSQNHIPITFDEWKLSYNNGVTENEKLSKLDKDNLLNILNDGDFTEIKKMFNQDSNTKREEHYLLRYSEGEVVLIDFYKILKVENKYSINSIHIDGDSVLSCKERTGIFSLELLEIDNKNESQDILVHTYFDYDEKKLNTDVGQFQLNQLDRLIYKCKD